jgi:hypothetical protein
MSINKNSPIRPGVVLNGVHRTGHTRICISNDEYRLILPSGVVDETRYSIWQYQHVLGLVPARMCTRTEAMMVGLNPNNPDFE